MKIVVGSVYKYVPNEAMLDRKRGPGTYESTLNEEMKVYGNKKIKVLHGPDHQHYNEPSYRCRFVDDDFTYTILESCIKSIGPANKPGVFK